MVWFNGLPLFGSALSPLKNKEETPHGLLLEDSAKIARRYVQGVQGFLIEMSRCNSQCFSLESLLNYAQGNVIGSEVQDPRHGGRWS